MRPRWTRAERAALAALLVSVGLTLAKLFVWQRTGSLAVLSQALDSALDIVAMGLVFLGVRLAARPADHNHHYGHGKAESLAALAQTLLLGGVVVGILVEAASRLQGGPPPLDIPTSALGLFVLTILVDSGRVAWLLAAGREEGSDALRAGALNFAADIGTAMVTLLSLVAVRSGLLFADPAGALVVGGTVTVAAVAVGRRALAALMDTAPDPQMLDAVQAAVSQVCGVTEVRRVRLRSEPHRMVGDVIVAAEPSATLAHAHGIADEVKRAVASLAPGADVVVHVEPNEGTLPN